MIYTPSIFSDLKFFPRAKMRSGKSEEGKEEANRATSEAIPPGRTVVAVRIPQTKKKTRVRPGILALSPVANQIYLFSLF